MCVWILGVFLKFSNIHSQSYCLLAHCVPVTAQTDDSGSLDGDVGVLVRERARERCDSNVTYFWGQSEIEN